MSKNVFLVLMLTYCQSMLLGQVNYLDYHKKMCQIEQVIVSENFAQAEVSMDSLFNQYPYVFTKDYVIAAQISAANNHPLHALKYLEKAMKQGYKLNCILDCLVFKNTVVLPEYYELVAKADSLQSIYRKSINQNLNIEFTKRYRTEQNAKAAANYKSIVYDNFNRIKAVIDSVGFPNERIIGIDDNILDPQLKDCSVGNSRIIPTLLHYDYAFSELESRLYKALEKGYLRPSEMANIYTFQRAKKTGLYKTSEKSFDNVPEYRFNFPFWERIKDIERVDKDRAKFGIIPSKVEGAKKAIEEKYGMKLSFGY